jgi:hypothetical protein
MKAIADDTGGRWFAINSTSPPDQLSREFNEAFSIVSTELRAQYTIGFDPSLNPGPGAGRIRVRAVNPTYHVRTRG